MKKILKATLIGSALGLLSLSGFPVIGQEKPAVVSGPAIKGAAVPSTAKPAADEASPELRKAAEAVAKAMDRKDCEKAFEFMTPKGESEFIGSMLLQITSMTQMDGGGGGEMPESFRELKKLTVDLGIDKVSMPQFEPSGAADDLDRMLKEVEEVRGKLLECIPEKDRRKAILAMMEVMSGAFVSPMSLEVGPIEVAGDRADVALVMKLDPAFAAQDGAAAPSMGEEAGPAEYLIFVKKEGAWKFDGFDAKRTMEQMAQMMAAGAKPFQAIENLSIEGKTFDDKAINLADYKGKVVLVDFWGTWCAPCVASLPELSGLHEKYKAKGFEILGVAADDVDTLKGFLEKKPLAWKHVVDAESEIAAKYNIEAFPTTLLIDKQGKHVATNLHGESLAKAVELLLDGKTIESINGSAGDILASAKKQAAQEKKLIFLHFGADWCVPCKVLEDWMSQPEIKALFDKAFVDVKIDMDNNYGAQELLESLTSNAGGIPWFAILNSTDDKPVASCEDGGGSAGVPDSDEGYDRFTKMFESTGKLKVEELSSIRSSISKVVEDFKAKSSK